MANQRIGPLFQGRVQILSEDSGETHKNIFENNRSHGIYGRYSTDSSIAITFSQAQHELE
jgi:hypothetical protein